MTLDGADIERVQFCAALDHWGRAARGLHGPKGLGRPDGAEPLPDWGPADDEMERIVASLWRGDQGELRVQAIRLYYVEGRGDGGSAVLLRVKVGEFERFRSETERLLFDAWLRRRSKFDKSLKIT